MSRYALIDLNTRLVANVIDLNPGSDWPVPGGYILVASDLAGPGNLYIPPAKPGEQGQFIPGPPAPDSAALQRKADIELVSAALPAGVRDAFRRLFQ